MSAPIFFLWSTIKNKNQGRIFQLWIMLCTMCVCENILTLMNIVPVYTKCLYVILISILLIIVLLAMCGVDEQADTTVRECPELLGGRLPILHLLHLLYKRLPLRYRHRTPTGPPCRGKRVHVQKQARSRHVEQDRACTHSTIRHHLHHFCRGHPTICTIHSLPVCRPLHVTFLLLISIDYWAFRVDRTPVYSYNSA